MKNILFVFFAALLFLFGCKETIVEYQTPKEFTNDLLHGDIVGKVIQNSSNAKVIISQVNPIDSATINSQDGSFAFHDLRAGTYDLTIRADNFRIYTRSNLLLQGGSVLYVGQIDLSTVPDLVDSHYPANGGEVVYDWRFGRISISVLFTQPMDRVSVEKAFSTNPPSEGIFTWGSFTQAPIRTIFADEKGAFDPGATITTFSKITSFTYSFAKKDSYVDTAYTVTVATTAHDTAGHYLRFPLKFSFRTVQSYTTVYGIQTSPSHGDIDVSPLSNYGITLTFPRRMDPASTEAATAVTPQMNKVFLWPDGNVMRIYTGGPFLSDTTISVTVDSTAKDKDGNLLGQRFSFWFRTAPLAVSYTTPGNAQLFVSLSQPVQISFDNYVVLSTVQSAFSISPSAGGTFSYGGYSPNENLSEVIFTPSTTYQPNTKYTVTVSTVVKDMYGVSMKRPYSFSFVTRPN